MALFHFNNCIYSLFIPHQMEEMYATQGQVQNKEFESQGNLMLAGKTMKCNIYPDTYNSVLQYHTIRD